jgi:lysozyme
MADHMPPAAGAAADPAAPAHSPAAALVAAIGVAAAALVMLLVPPFEGTVQVGYRDIAGVVTACTGHTKNAVLGRRYTPQQCADFLVGDLVVHAKDLGCITHPLQPYEKAALLSFVFNVGHGKAGVKDGLCRLKSGAPSTLVRLANAGDMQGACAQLSHWVGVRGRDCRAAASRCAGIVERRKAERAMCEGSYQGAELVGSAAAPAQAGAAMGAPR